MYAQKVNSVGITKWTKNGMPIYTGLYDQDFSSIVSDGKGGAIMAWVDSRGTLPDIYVQKVSSLGFELWTSGGIRPMTTSFAKGFIRLQPDGSGGVFMVWAEKHGSYTDIYAQRLNSSGTKLWTTTGVAVCTSANDQKIFDVVCDGLGGIIVVWEDERISNKDIYAQKINSSGIVQWTSNGVAISKAPTHDYAPKICSDKMGGAIISWSKPNTGGYSVGVQHLTAAGNVTWGTNGKIIGAGKWNRLAHASDYSSPIGIISDGNYGALVTWSQRMVSQNNIWANRIDSTGNGLWTDTGVIVCKQSYNQEYPQIVLSTTGSPIIVWEDYRNSTDGDLYAQILNSNGTIKGKTNGIEVSIANNYQQIPSVVTDGNGGAIVAWDDYRNGVDLNIYVQKINSNGVLAVSPAPEIDVKGKSISILSGSNSTTTSNGTDFGTIAIPATSVSTFEISNTGNDSLKINGIVTTSGNSSEFKVQTLTFPKYIAIGQKLQFTVTFMPSTSGIKNTILSIDNTDLSESSYTFALKGIASAKTDVPNFNYDSQNVILYPNPSADFLHINTLDKTKILSIELFNQVGSKVYEEKNPANNFITFDVSKLVCGIYYVRINSMFGYQMKKFQINR